MRPARVGRFLFVVAFSLLLSFGEAKESKKRYAEEYPLHLTLNSFSAADICFSTVFTEIPSAQQSLTKR